MAGLLTAGDGRGEGAGGDWADGATPGDCEGRAAKKHGECCGIQEWRWLVPYGYSDASSLLRSSVVFQEVAWLLLTRSGFCRPACLSSALIGLKP